LLQYYRQPGSNNFNYLLGWRGLDVCSIFGNPLLSKIELVDWCFKELPQMCHKCPYKANEYVAVNVSTSVGTSMGTCPVKNYTKKPLLTLGPRWWPDGDYRIDLNVYVNNRPDRVGKLTYYYREKTGNNHFF
jgi:hypothetical protein